MHKLIAQLRSQREDLHKRAQALLDLAAAETRDLNAEELTQYTDLRTKITELDERVAGLVVDAEREQAAAGIAARADKLGQSAGVSVGAEPLTYQKGDRSRSYFRDLGLAFVGNDYQARERLARHAREVTVELPKLAARKAEVRDTVLHGAEQRDSFAAFVGEQRAEVESRDITRTDNAGGEFVPPLWLLDEYAGLARAGRITADRYRRIPLPGGTDSINIPRITTGTATGVQTADNGSVTETDMVTNSVAAPVRTIAGQQDIALQLLEQSPLMFDELVFADLAADYNMRLNIQVINGSGSSGQVLGILGVSGINAVTYTDASPTVPELFPKGADAIQQIMGARYLPPTAHVFHPRRWFWMTAAVDSSSRPLVVPTINAPMNALAIGTDVLAEGPVGFFHGLPVWLDPSIPTNLGAGTNEDRVITSRFADHILFEGVLRTRALPEVLSGNLTVRLQVYAYVAATAGRFPASTSVIAGTGLVTPTF